MKIFLTGGTGLLGRYFAELAVSQGAQLVALLRPTSQTRHLQSLGATLHIGDLADGQNLAAGMQGCEVVVHLASLKGGWRRPELFERHIVQGKQHVLEAMKQSGVASLLYVSSICVYGLDPTLGSPVNESSGFGQTFLPYDYYGLAKIAAEKSVAAAHQAGHIQATVVRPGWFYGSHDEGSYGRLATRTRQRLLLKVGSGENRLPLVYVGNVADILYQCLAQPSRDYRVYLYAADGPITQNEYLASLARASGSTQKPITVSQSLLLKVALLQEVAYVWSRYWLPTWQTRQFVHLWGSDWSFDQHLVTQELGYQAQVGYEAGLAATEAWYQNRHQAG